MIASPVVIIVLRVVEPSPRTFVVQLLVADAVMYCVAAVFTSNVTVLLAADVETDVLSIGDTKIGFVVVAVLIVGEVKVLFVSVSLPARDATSASETAVFNCARVDVIVLVASEIDLFVRVCVEAALFAQVSPEVVEESVIKTYPFVDADKTVIESFALPASKSPLALIEAVGIKGLAIISVESLSTQIVPVVNDVVGALFVNTAVAPVGTPPRVPSASTQIYPSGTSAGEKSAGAGCVFCAFPPDDGRASNVAISCSMSYKNFAIELASRDPGDVFAVLYVYEP